MQGLIIGSSQNFDGGVEKSVSVTFDMSAPPRER
jgi:hypothetical protein